MHDLCVREDETMDFSQILNQYMEKIPCSAKELAEECGLSASTISRYRSGQRTPSKTDLLLLTEALVRLSKNSKESVDTKKMQEALRQALPNLAVDKASFSGRFSALIRTLPVNRKALAADCGYDPSFLSKILSGDRAPADYTAFAKSVADHIAGLCLKEGQIGVLCEIIKEDLDPAIGMEPLADKIASWLLFTDEATPPVSELEATQSFLKKLAEFDLNDYMKRIHFDKLIVPTLPLQAKSSKAYAGLEGMKKAELEFLRRAVLSTATGPVWEYSSLPMEEPASDEAFSKKWMMRLAMLLKKGQHLHIIHDINRPFAEMMLGLESWIPLYMTGLIHSYYFKTPPSGDYRHMIRLSGDCGMSGECMGADLSTAVFYLTTKPEELSGMRKRKDAYFRQASPLIRVYEGPDPESVLRESKKEDLPSQPEVITDSQNAFYKNIRIALYGDVCAVISKETETPIHLIVEHPLLIGALHQLKDLPADAPGPFPNP